MRIGEVIIGIAIAAALGMVVAAFLFVRSQGGDSGLATSLFEPLTQEFETNGRPEISVESWRGAVTVRPGRANLVTVVIGRTGTGATEQEAFENLTKLESRALEDEENVITVRTFRTNDAPAPPGTRAPITIDAPEHSRLNVIATGPEPVIVEGITGDISIEAEGSVTVEIPHGIGFTIDAMTMSGNISDLIGIDGSGGRTLVGERPGDVVIAIVLRAGGGITLRER